MTLTEDDIIKIKELLHEDGLTTNDSPEDGFDGSWDSSTQLAWDAYIKRHESDLAHLMVGRQPGSIAELGMTLQHCFDKGVSLAEAAKQRFLGWFSDTKERVFDELDREKKDIEESAEKVKAAAKEASDKAKAVVKAAKDELKKDSKEASDDKVEAETKGKVAGSGSISIDRTNSDS